MQTTLPGHLQSIVVPKVSIHYQISDYDPILQHFELVFDQFLDAFQFWCQFNLGFVTVATAFWTSTFLL